MSDKEWERMVKHVDEYLDAAREELKEMKEKQEEAAQKMAAEAPADMKSIMAAQAALQVAANGFMGNATGTDASELEKQSWSSIQILQRYMCHCSRSSCCCNSGI